MQAARIMMVDPSSKETVSEHEKETNRLFRKYLIVATTSGFTNGHRGRTM